MNKKILVIIMFIFFLNNCGFTPIYLNQTFDLKIGKIESSGDRDIIEAATQKIKKYQTKSETDEKTFNLNLICQKEKIILSKDTSGNADVYKIKITINFEGYIDNGVSVNGTLSQDSNYNVDSSESTMQFTENKLIVDLTHLIINEIILTLNSALLDDI